MKNKYNHKDIEYALEVLNNPQLSCIFWAMLTPSTGECLHLLVFDDFHCQK
jgi:hypothetical protein